MEGTRLFTVYRDASRCLCEVRWDFQDRELSQRTRDEQRLFLQLSPSLVAVNTWLTILGADTGYFFGTIYEYAKVLSYTLTWLAQKPVQLGTGHRVELSLFSLSRADMRALFAWLDIPASASGARQSLCKTGQLPVGYREHALSAATRNGRLAALSTFYDWLIAEYLPENSPVESAPSHMNAVDAWWLRFFLLHVEHVSAVESMLIKSSHDKFIAQEMSLLPIYVRFFTSCWKRYVI